ncbi:hypothetical protein ACIOHE_39175 [Streptomyces sp. NPDC087851]|uniref:hypothetical protein n=1 Tax=Streptomyces sp. NPDC087851 TaxID=3365810 RepID=UPI0038264DC0
MRTRTTAAIAAVLLAALTACSSSDSDDTKPAATTEAAEVAEKESTPPPAPAEPMSFGAPYEWENTSDGAEGTSTVLAYDQDVKSVASASEETGTDGYVWSALELKVCSTTGTFTVTTSPWILAYADGTRAEPSSTTYDDFPRPEFPFEETLTQGKCVRGKVVYATPGDSRPESVIYAPEGLAEPVEWTVPAT